jgi:hypothetical protein
MRPSRQDLIYDGECDGIGDRVQSQRKTARERRWSTSIWQKEPPMRMRSPRFCASGRPLSGLSTGRGRTSGGPDPKLCRLAGDRGVIAAVSLMLVMPAGLGFAVPQ